MNNVFYSNRTDCHFCIADMDREVQFLLYYMPEDSGKVQVVVKDETIWSTQRAMALLFEPAYQQSANI